jgi:hypothetical protein
MVRAFLGCSQLMSGYCKDLQITSAPLHKLTKKSTAFPKPWMLGTDYDLAVHRIKSILLDTQLYLHHKNPLRSLFIGVVAPNDERIGDPKDEGRIRISDNGPRNVIQWANKP